MLVKCDLIQEDMISLICIVPCDLGALYMLGSSRLRSYKPIYFPPRASTEATLEKPRQIQILDSDSAV